jgi:hypothetical protein
LYSFFERFQGDMDGSFLSFWRTPLNLSANHLSQAPRQIDPFPQKPFWLSRFPSYPVGWKLQAILLNVVQLREQRGGIKEVCTLALRSSVTEECLPRFKTVRFQFSHEFKRQSILFGSVPIHGFIYYVYLTPYCASPADDSQEHIIPPSG